MSKVLINKLTNQQLSAFLKSPSNVLLLTGQAGSGKEYLARHIAEELLNDDAERLLVKGSLYELPDNAGIDNVRGLIREVSLKTAHKRAVIINQIELLGHEAQNALLKTLEEAPANTFFILIASQPARMLATIRSRATLINVRPIELNKIGDSASAHAETNWILSDGLAGTLSSLEADQSSELLETIAAAKEFLRLDSYQRLIFLDKYSSRVDLSGLLDALTRVLKAVSNSTARNGNKAMLDRLIASRRQLLQLRLMLDANSSVKLVSLSLVTSLKV
jgi:hypothetical protein